MLQGMEVQNDMYSDGTLMDEVMQLMLQAERHSAGDPGVQVRICMHLSLSLCVCAYVLHELETFFCSNAEASARSAVVFIGGKSFRQTR